MPQDRITDPNWGLPAAAVPVAAAPERVTDPNWGQPSAIVDGQPHFAGQSEPGIVDGVARAWEFANTPLVPQIATGARAAANVVDRPMMGDQYLNDWVPGLGTASAMVRGGAAGMVEGAGDLAASFTSPVGIALWLAGQGEVSALAKYLPAIKPYLTAPAARAIQRAVQGAAGAGFTAEGAQTIAQAETLGDVGRGVAQVGAGVVGMVSAAKPGGAAVPAPRRTSLLTPEAQASNAFAEAHGIPLDPTTATGSKWVNALQQRLAHSMGGQRTVAERFQQQSKGLAAAGRDLAGEVHPAAVTAEQAGQALEGSLINTAGREAEAAARQYARVEEMQADPRYAAEVPAPRPTQQAAEALKERMRSSLGYAPNSGELNELRRMSVEMREFPYVKRTWNDITHEVGKKGNAGGGNYEIVKGAGGAPVYDDILKSLRSADYVPTRQHVERMINESLETGRFNEVSKAAFDVAQRRLANDPAVTKPWLPASAGEVPDAPPVTMGMPVALKPLQDAMRAEHAELQARHDVVPLMGKEAESLRILTKLMNAPEWVPVTVADKVLGQLKSIARADVPALRTEGQGIAAQAVKTLSAQIDEIASQVPGASEALAAGRTATVNKYAAKAVLDQLREAPTETFNLLIGPRNQGLHLLRQLNVEAPEVLPQVGRARIDQWMDTATAETGKFQHAARIAGEYEKMGAESKQLLWGDKVPALDDFFLLMKRIAGQPLGSDTAYKLSGFDFVAQLATIPITKVLYSKGTLGALNKLAKLDARIAGANVSGAAREAAWAGLAMAAEKAGVPGVPYRMPQAAQADRDDQATRRPAP